MPRCDVLAVTHGTVGFISRRAGGSSAAEDCACDAFSAGRVVIHATMRTESHGDVHLDVVYLDTFPRTRITVFAPDLDLERHQQPFTKNLCVLAQGSDQWHPRWLAATVVSEQVPRLLGLLTGPEETLRDEEEPQGEPFTDYYQYHPLGAVLVSDGPWQREHDDRPSRGVCELQFRDRQPHDWLASDRVGEPPIEVGQAVMISIAATGSDPSWTAPDEVRHGLRGDVWRVDWVRLHEPIRAASADKFANELAGLSSVLDLNAPKLSKRVGRLRARIIGVAFQEEVRQSEYDDAWVFLVLLGTSQKELKLRATPSRAASQPEQPRRAHPRVGSATTLNRGDRWDRSTGC